MALTPPVWFELGRGIIAVVESILLKLLLMNEGSDSLAASNAVFEVYNSPGSWPEPNGDCGLSEETLTRTPKPIWLADVSQSMYFDRDTSNFGFGTVTGIGSRPACSINQAKKQAVIKKRCLA